MLLAMLHIHYLFGPAFVMKNRPSNVKAIILAIFAVFLAVGVQKCIAATQGSLAANSSGSLVISVVKPPRANISGLSDLSVSGWVVGDGDQTVSEDICVYSTRPSGGYTVKATGTGSGNGFTLAYSGRTLPYQVRWNAGGVGALSNSALPLTANSPSPFTHAATDSSSCSGAIAGPTARLLITFLASSLTSVSAGTYAGTLTLMITPN